jgi:hypothetical protein
MRPLTLCLLITLAATAGCKGAPEQADGGAPPDSAAPADLGCFVNPVTHLQIINACTSAQQVDKKPSLPLLRPDGTLPPLP